MNFKKILSILLLLFFLYAPAQDRILDFDSKIQIEQSGNLQIVETITIKTDGSIFKNGFFRVLPLSRKDKNDNTIDIEYHINSISKDGIPENYLTKKESGKCKIYIGKKDVVLKNGTYKYQISYSTPFQIGSFDTYNELYWNLNGCDWRMIIEKFSCQIFLPPSNNKFESINYDKNPGSLLELFTKVSLNKNKTIANCNTSHFNSEEGITLTAKFPKGIINTPSSEQIFEYNQERILSFDSKIKIERSGNINVVETISIKAKGDIFKRGLYRQLPLTRKDKNGNNIDVEYKINSIKIDGDFGNYFTKNESDYFKIYIGNKDVFLEKGIYEYQIDYSIPLQIGYFDTYDELYWNITGNEWNMPIDKASCQIYLPSINNIFQNTRCYTGLLGSEASDCICLLIENNTVASFTAIKLKEREGLTVAASFPKGIVNPQTSQQKSMAFYNLIKTRLWSVIFGLGMSFFFYFNWKKYGKDPTKKAVIPEFTPPFNWSPAVVGYVHNRELNDQTYMASLINIAVKGAMKICSIIEKGVFTNSNLYEIEIKNKGALNLSLEEEKAFKYLSERDKLLFSQTNYKIFENANDAWNKSLQGQISLEEFYHDNTRKKWIGFFILIVAGLTFEVLTKSKGNTDYLFFTVLIIASSAMTYWYSKKIVGIGQMTVRFILGILILAPAVFIFFSMLFYLKIIPMMVIVLVFLIYAFYAWNLGKFTQKGADAIEKIEGFKLYLETAEKDRMNMLNPPELTPKLFEELFPYAIALGVEINWGEQFEKTLELAKYNPEWYQGDGNFYNRPTLFLSSFNDSVSSSSTDPTPSSSSSSGSSGSSGSWSSGSSGGGSSGGGGGGGGGGGW